MEVKIRQSLTTMLSTYTSISCLELGCIFIEGEDIPEIDLAEPEGASNIGGFYTKTPEEGWAKAMQVLGSLIVAIARRADGQSEGEAALQRRCQEIKLELQK